jgi:excisionase family DNA binding protein
MLEFPLINLNDEASPTLDSAAMMAALNKLKQDPKFRAYIGTGTVGATLDEIGPGQPLPTETKPDDNTPVATFVPQRNGNSGRKFNSSKPNQAMLWALIDDSPQGAEDHELALSIKDGWQPSPWKGQIWRARLHEPNSKPERVWIAPSMDLIWSGSEWFPHTGLPVIYKPLLSPQHSTVSVKLTDLFKVELDRETQLEGIKIAVTEVNEAYTTYLLNPEDKLDNLMVTIAAYARSKGRMAQYRLFMRRNPELSTTADDVFMEFTAYLFKYLPSYKHCERDEDGNLIDADCKDKLDRWINMSWHKHFWPGYQTQTIDYLNSTRFVNNADPNSRGYIHYGYAVRTAEIATDSDAAEANGEVNAVQRFIKEMNDPNLGSPYFKLSPASKLMLQGALEGETAKMLAKKTGVTPQHALRLLETAKAEARAIVAGAPTLQDDDESTLLEWPSLGLQPDGTYNLNGAADEPTISIADRIEEFDHALTVRELATLLGCSTRQIYELVQDKRLPAIMIGTSIRLDPGQTADWIRSKMTIAA